LLKEVCSRIYMDKAAYGKPVPCHDLMTLNEGEEGDEDGLAQRIGAQSSKRSFWY
jgi:hypothetical protein